MLARPATKLRRLMGVALGQSNTLAHHRTTTVQCGTAKGLMSALGQKQTSDWQPLMSALPPKADIAGRQLNVRFVPKGDIPAISNGVGIR
jgi:hypothetical protein